MGEAPGPGACGEGIDAPGAARDAPGAALVDARPTASVGGAATAFDDDVGLLVKHGRSEGEGGSGATGSGGRSRRKAGQASAQGLIEEIGVWTRQGRCSTSCASCRPPPNSQGRCSTSCASCSPPPNMTARTPMRCAMLRMYLFHWYMLYAMLYANLYAMLYAMRPRTQDPQLAQTKRAV